MFKNLLVLLLFFHAALNGEAIYLFKNDPIDVVIPCTQKDLLTLELCIEKIKEHCVHVGRVIVVSAEPLTSQAEWFNEALYPFQKEEVAACLPTTVPPSRVGWYYQQLLKLYAPFVIPGISSNVLVLDADTLFFKPTSFLNEKYGGCYNVGSEHHLPYFRHAGRLTKNRLFRVYSRYSGICHHMLFQRPVLQELFTEVEAIQREDFWKAFCRQVDPASYWSGASEYELYFNYVFLKTRQVSLRFLKWANITHLEEMERFEKEGYDYVSCHDYLRGGG